MARDVIAEFVVRQARSAVQPEGDIELADVREGVACIRYRKAANPRCLECSVSPEGLREFLLSMFAQKAPHIRDVLVELEE